MRAPGSGYAGALSALQYDDDSRQTNSPAPGFVVLESFVCNSAPSGVTGATTPTPTQAQIVYNTGASWVASLAFLATTE